MLYGNIIDIVLWYNIYSTMIFIINILLLFVYDIKVQKHDYNQCKLNTGILSLNIIYQLTYIELYFIK